jgi:hypothetical protein
MANGESFTPGENQDVMARSQVAPNLPSQLPENPLGPVPRHRRAQTLPHHDADSAVSAGLVRQGPHRAGNKIKQRGLKAMARLFHTLDVGAVPQEEQVISQRPGHQVYCPQTVSRARPLALRRAKIFRPFFVLILFLKP